MAGNPGYPNVQLVDASSVNHRRKLAETVNRINGGKFNCTLDVTLVASSGTTPIVDARIGYYSAIIPATALTSDAATDIAAGIWVSDLMTGQATLNHRNNAGTDRTIRFVILG